MNSTTTKLDWTKQRLGGLSRFASIAYWSVIVSVAGVSVFLIWPDPYVFRVSQVTFQAVEKKDGEFVPLDDYETGYEKLAAFERKCRIVFFLSGVVGACSIHLIASLLTGRDVTVAIVIIAIPFIAGGMWIADRYLPETVDPVYGDGFQITFPLWVHIVASPLWVIVATVVEFCILAVRWVMGRYVLRVSLMANEENKI